MARIIFPSENDEGRDFISKPSMTKEKISIRKKQAPIPFTLSGNLLAFLRLYPTAKSQPEKVNNFSQCYLITMPSAFKERCLDLSFMETFTRVFQSASPTQSKKYLSRLNKVKSKRQKQWEDLCIFDMIQISRVGPRYNPTMLLASIFFWEGSTNTFLFPCVMLTPTLFNVASITLLNPLDETFTLTIETNHEFIIERFSFKNFIIDHHYKKNDEVSNQEHIALLTLWLSYYVFCPGSLQISNKYVPLAIQLYEGQKDSLAKLLLAKLYQPLGNASYKLKHLPEINKSYLISGPLWLLQLQLNYTFEPKLHITESKALLEETDCRSIEGTKLALVTPYDNPLQITFMKYINLFLESKNFVFDHGSFGGHVFWSILVSKEVPWCNPFSYYNVELYLGNLFDFDTPLDSN